MEDGHHRASSVWPCNLSGKREAVSRVPTYASQVYIKCTTVFCTCLKFFSNVFILKCPCSCSKALLHMIKPSKGRVGVIVEEGRRSDNQTNEQHSSVVSTNIYICIHALLRNIIYPDDISFLTKLPFTAQFPAGMGCCHTALNKSLILTL